MQFCLDSDVYITASNFYYNNDFAQGFWQALELKAIEKVICSPINVYNEIQKGKDWLANWMKLIKQDLIVTPDAQTGVEMGRISNFVFEKYVPHQSSLFLNAADPWVIAYALAHNLVVVTLEKRINNLPLNSRGQLECKVKIPNICDEFGMECIDTFELLRRVNISLQLKT